ncbi:hypothetical protein L1049_015821 [Liquidambar formosana]|uniref:Uncharacterized protein n=1 Tax=Liquidambar formosana TaxID=63359 RepID=A0AAP0S5B2_LIQFO
MSQKKKIYKSGDDILVLIIKLHIHKINSLISQDQQRNFFYPFIVLCYSFKIRNAIAFNLPESLLHGFSPQACYERNHGKKIELYSPFKKLGLNLTRSSGKG